MVLEAEKSKSKVLADLFLACTRPLSHCVLTQYREQLLSLFLL